MQAYQRRKLVLAFKHCILRTSLWNVSKQYYFNHNTLLYNLIHVKLPPYLLPSLVEDIGSIASGLCHAGDHAIYTQMFKHKRNRLYDLQNYT